MEFDAVIHRTEGTGNLLAYATLIISDGDERISIDGFKVMNGQNGMWISLPRQESNKIDEKTGKKVWFDTTHFLEEKEDMYTPGPLQQKARNAILEAYRGESNTNSHNRSVQNNNYDRPVQNNNRPNKRTFNEW